MPPWRPRWTWPRPPSGQRVTGLVNAVLRRVAAHDLDHWLTALSEGLEPLDRLAVRTAHPRWIVDAYADLLPPEEVEPALRANNADVPVTLAVRPGLAEVAELLAAGAEPSRHSPFAARWTGNPADLPAVREGRAGVQDEGSQLVTMALAAADAPRGRWLDLCAGPGGKTALLAGLADRTDSVLAVDVAPHRAALVRRAVRAYPDPPAVVVADGTRPAWRAGSFARVLADVPCTGLGALRRRPESRWRRQPGRGRAAARTPARPARLGDRQRATGRGGRLRHLLPAPARDHRCRGRDAGPPRRRRGDPGRRPATGIPRRRVPGTSLQLWPHRHGTDAMFAAYLRRL